MDYSKVRGFNYQPSYGSTSYENWLYFSPQIVELELRRGKQYFPGMNTIRLWLSWDAYLRDPERFLDNFETSLRIADRLAMKVIPCLFNRWHDPDLDCGGVYVDHFMPGWSWITRKDKFTPYIEDIMTSHNADDRILAWDICNEPFSYEKPIKEMREIEKVEFEWLEKIYRQCKELKVKQPLGVSIHPKEKRWGLERIEPISDLLMVHPYYVFDQDNTEKKENFIQLLDDYGDVGKKSGKPMVITEACWGSLDDSWRAENVKYSLTEFRKRNIGFVLHALHYSKVADLHNPEDGPVGRPGNLAFINKDGTLRKGHEVFNEF